MESSALASASFTSATTLTQRGLSHLPKSYILPPSERPNCTLSTRPSTLPIIDLSSLQLPLLRSRVVEEVRLACKELGFFQVHAISSYVHVTLHSVTWMRVRELLFLLKEDIEEGSQVMAVNYYPACPEPELALGLPPHTDYSLLSIILQNQQGLQILDQDKNWHSVPVIDGGLIVQLGDQMEVLSNGQYKAVNHRATVNSEKCRISIASLHSLALEKKVGPAPKLVDKKNPLSYKEGSFGDFLNFISGNDITATRFIDTLKINQ